jgi:hypothetical protein
MEVESAAIATALIVTLEGAASLVAIAAYLWAMARTRSFLLGGAILLGYWGLLVIAPLAALRALQFFAPPVPERSAFLPVMAWCAPAILMLALNTELLGRLARSWRRRVVCDPELRWTSLFRVTRARAGAVVAFLAFMVTAGGVVVAWIAALQWLRGDAGADAPAFERAITFGAGIGLGIGLGAIPYRWCLIHVGGLSSRDVAELEAP